MNFIKKHLRRKVRAFIYSLLCHFAISFFILPTAFYFTAGLAGYGLEFQEVIQILGSSAFLFGFLFLPIYYMMFNAAPEFDLDFILEQYKLTRHAPLIAIKRTDGPSYPYLHIIVPVGGKKFRIYSNLHVLEMYDGKAIETNAAKSISEELIKSIPDYEYR